MSAFLFRRPAGLALFVLFVLTFPPSAGPSEAQGIDDLSRTGRAGYAACRHKLAQMAQALLRDVYAKAKEFVVKCSPNSDRSVILEIFHMPRW